MNPNYWRLIQLLVTKNRIIFCCPQLKRTLILDTGYPWILNKGPAPLKLVFQGSWTKRYRRNLAGQAKTPWSTKKVEFNGAQKMQAVLHLWDHLDPAKQKPRVDHIDMSLPNGLPGNQPSSLASCDSNWEWAKVPVLPLFAVLSYCKSYYIKSFAQTHTDHIISYHIISYDYIRLYNIYITSYHTQLDWLYRIVSYHHTVPSTDTILKHIISHIKL